MNKRYDNGELVTASRIQDEEWYYTLYQPFLEYCMSFYQRRDVRPEELFEGYKEFCLKTFKEYFPEKEEERLLRWSVLHAERNNHMPDFIGMETKLLRRAHIQKEATIVLELTKGFTPEQRKKMSEGTKTSEELAQYILELIQITKI